MSDNFANRYETLNPIRAPLFMVVGSDFRRHDNSASLAVVAAERSNTRSGVMEITTLTSDLYQTVILSYSLPAAAGRISDY
jgi:hypothetical protein